METIGQFSKEAQSKEKDSQLSEQKKLILVSYLKNECIHSESLVGNNGVPSM